MSSWRISAPALWALLRFPGLRARVLLRRDFRSFARLQFLAACLQVGILDLLSEWRSAGDIAARLELRGRESLRTLLDLGVALGELRLGPAGYRLSGAMSRALVADGGDGLAATVLELVDYHGLVYRDICEHLRTGRAGDYLQDRATLVQRSSRIVEPALGAFAGGLARGNRAIRVLELGCGSGVYLRHVCEANPRASGVGVEADAEVAATARQNMSRWGISERVRIVHADARRLPAEVDGQFELVTLYNNIYYFALDERTRLFASLRQRLTGGGRLAVVSMLRGATPASLELDLVLGATRGCTSLPTRFELRSALSQSGFTCVSERRLLPGEPFVGLVCSIA